MRANVWGLLTAAIGMAIIILLVVYGTAWGTWIDEVGSSLDIAEQASAPTIILPAVIGLLAVVLVIGGVAVGVTVPRDQRDAAPLGTE